MTLIIIINRHRMTSKRPKRRGKIVNYAILNNGEVNDDDSSDVEAQIPEDNDEDDEDVQDTEHEDDEDDLVPEEPDGEILEESQKSKRKGKKTASKVKTPVKAPAKVVAQYGKKEIRNSKQITSIKEKFLRFFGNNEQKLIQLIQLRKDWEHSLFTIDLDKLDKQLPPIDLKIPNAKLKTLTKDTVDKEFSLKTEPINFQFEDQETQIIAKSSSVSNGTTTVLNTGGLITDLVWLPTAEEEQTLVVSISNITDNSISSNFRVLSRNSYNAAFQFFKFNIKTKETRLVKTLLHNWGAAWDLKATNTNDLIISAVFNDGNVRLIKVDDNDGSDAWILEPSVELTIPDHIISTYDWLNNDIIIVGSETGHIAEFNILDPEEPSYLYPLHSDYIFSLSASRSEFDESIVYSSCSDGTSAIFNTTDIVTSINRTPKSRAMSKTVLYSPQLYSFIQLEGPYTTKAIPKRANFGSTSISKHDGSTESVAISSIHPFVVTGGADGRVKLANLARKLLNGQKQSTGGHKILTVFNLQYGAKERLYRYVEDQNVEILPAVDNINNVNIYPQEISVSSLKWNESNLAGNWFVAGTTSGLLIFKKIE